MKISGTIDLSVEVERHVAIVKFYILDKFGANVLLGCDFCDKEVEVIRPRRRSVELENDITVPVTHDALIETKTKVPIMEAQICAKQTR